MSKPKRERRVLSGPPETPREKERRERRTAAYMREVAPLSAEDVEEAAQLQKRFNERSDE